MGPEHSGKPLAWFTLLLLLLLLALMVWMRTLPVQAPESTAPVLSTVSPELSTPSSSAKETDPPEAEVTANGIAEDDATPPGPVVYTKESYQLVSDLVYTYAAKQRDGEAEIRTELAALKELDPRAGVLWERILRYWDFVNEDLQTSSATPPEGLPQDDSLCIVVLGFQLHADGSMAEELLGRCETALAFASAYPEAWIAVTGGGTAWQNKTVTEAGAMAQWLIEHGVAAERVLVEDRSLTTADNAVFTCELLCSKAPQVKTLAVVSSDYHVPLGALLFEEKALILEAEEGEKPFSVEGIAAYDTQGRFRPDSPMEQMAYVWSVADPKF